MELFRVLVKPSGTWLFLFSRVLAGLLFFVHGLKKFGLIGDGSISGFASNFGMPLFIALLVGIIEVAGGALIALGAFTRLAAALSALVMLGAYLFVHFPKHWSPFSNGGELALVFFSVFLLFFIMGSGKYSIEKAMLGKEFF